MCMPGLSRRLQILLDEGRYQRLARLARGRKTSVATLVREAIDVAYPQGHRRREEAGRRLLDAEPIAVSDWPELKREIEELGDTRTP